MEIAIPDAGIIDIIFFRPLRVSGDWTSFGEKFIKVNKIPRTKAATAMDDFWANVINPYKEDSLLMPDFHSPYSMVSGNIDQNNTPPAPDAKPIKQTIIISSKSELIW